ncbi:MAG TPA: chloride channel protein [Holophagaceae bacterium]|nr:chloride channel protein [Holophagaceae bacterium]
MSHLPARLNRLTWDLVMGALVGLLCGGAAAGFLFLLARTIDLRKAHPALLLALPLLGLLSAWIYRRWGGGAEGGTALVLDEVTEWSGQVPSRMAPLVLVGTLLAHLGGASVGREGTAVQMGAALGRTLAKARGRLGAWLRLTRTRQRMLLQAGLAGGFGAVFGTPLAGGMFGLEVVSRGGLRTEALVICLASSLVGDRIALALGVHHTPFLALPPELTGLVWLKLLAFVPMVAAAAWAYVHASHGLAKWTRTTFAWWMRPLFGGAAFACLMPLFSPAHLNLGTDWLPRVFSAGSVPTMAFALKLAITAWCLGWGFKGGEVTPLFVSGALLGAVAAGWLHLPAPFLGAVGFVTLFGAASHTPLTSLLLGLELFGAPFAAPILVVGSLAYGLVGARSLYRA